MSYVWNINTLGSPIAFKIGQAVDTHHSEPTMSPLDRYIQRSQELMLLLVDPNNFKGRLESLKHGGKLSDDTFNLVISELFVTTGISHVLSNLVLLGHVSAVESYLRALFRGLIRIDQETELALHDKQISFGAALAYDSSSMPDAMLEHISLGGQEGVNKLLKDFFGVKRNNPPSLDTALVEYENLCQLRHCIVHKFGIVGHKNVSSDSIGNRNLVNKPIKCDFATIQLAGHVCWNLVHIINQYLWEVVMFRMIGDGTKKKSNIPWAWTWKMDSVRFSSYFELFNATLSHPANLGVKSAYLEYEKTYLGLK